MGFLNWILRRIFKYLSPIISVFEKHKIKKYSSKDSKYEPVFIIGPPRSGSTILYQLITNFLNVNYIDNLCNLSRRNLYFGMWLSNLFFKRKNHNNFDSNYGNTRKYGLHAPSEGGQIWYRWFGRNITYFEKGMLTQKSILQIKNIFRAIDKRFGKPVVIKNLTFSQRIKVLHDIFPEAKFIIITRSPAFNAQSIYSARLKKNHSEWWSVKPKNYKDLLHLSLAEQCVGQVYYIEKQIFNDIKLFPEQQVKVICYEDLFTNCTEILDDLKTFIRSETRSDYSNIKIRPENKVKINKEDFNLIRKITENYNWEGLKKDK